MSVYLLFAMELGHKFSSQKALEDHCESSLKGRKLFSSPYCISSVSSAFVYVTKYSSMGLHPSMT